MAINFRDEQEIFTLKVDDTAKAHMLETMRWTKFVGIIFAILTTMICAFMTYMILVYLPVNMQTPTPMPASILVIMLLVIIGLNFFPIFALLRYSGLGKKAIATGDQQQFNRSLGYMKNLFKYIGILTIILIAFYGFVIVMAVVGSKGM